MSEKKVCPVWSTEDCPYIIMGVLDDEEIGFCNLAFPEDCEYYSDYYEDDDDSWMD